MILCLLLIWIKFFEYDLNEVISELSLNDAGVLSFESVHPRWAYVKCDENNFVLEAFEKKTCK